jgi:aminoglycoside 6'-N-acetyltransferase I
MYKQYLLPHRDVCAFYNERHMEIADLSLQSHAVLTQAAIFLVDQFDGPSGWPEIESAREEVIHIIDTGFALAALEGGTLLGWVGGLPEYNGHVWELHPLVVRRESRRQGIGRALVAAFEHEAARRGAFTFTLGTDDDAGMTSLAGVNLYDDVPRHIAELRDLGRNHPFLFYRRLGYVVTGVMPDANGVGRPDIFMSKSAKG